MIKQNNRAFSAVEISLVLLIIGLIFAGVSGSVTLYENAKTRKIVQDLVKYKSAAEQFREKYNAKPGDFASSATIWGTAVTASGNANGVVNGVTESYLAFNHLGLSGFIEQQYSPTNDATIIPNLNGGTAYAGRYKGGMNVPASPIDSGVYAYFSYAGFSGATGNSDDGEVVAMGYPCVGADSSSYAFSYNMCSLVEPKRAYEMDLKIDDGLSGSGLFFTMNGGELNATHTAQCITWSATNNPMDPENTYNLTSATELKKRTCAIYYGATMNRFFGSLYTFSVGSDQ